MTKMICFDMDGTIADLYAVDGWLGKLRTEDASPYEEAAPMWDMVELGRVLNRLIDKGWEVRIISWLSMNSSEAYKQAVRQAKIDWLKKYDFPYKTAHLVAYGTTKADCVRKYRPNAILIDDNSKVRQGWTLGETINPREENIIETLKFLLDN